MKRIMTICSVLLVLLSCKDKELKPSFIGNSSEGNTNSTTNAAKIQQTLENLEIDDNTTEEHLEEILESDAFVWPEQPETGIKATLRAEGSIVVLTCDHTNEDIEVQTQGVTTFLNDEGYVVVFNPKKQRWQKAKVGGFMESKIMNDFTNSFGKLPPSVSENLDSISKSESAMHNIVNWAKRMTPKKLAKNPDFDKDIKNCHESNGDVCIVFTGIEGEAKGVTIFFDIDFRLQHINFKNHGSVSYEYGEYNVQVPLAERIF